MSGKGIKNFLNENINVTDDYRSYIGSGPFNLSTGDHIEIGFAILAASNLTNLQANCDLAISDWNSGIVDVKEVIEGQITQYKLYQNYPNPFNPSTSITFSLPKTSFVTLTIYDLLGKELESLINKELGSGTHVLTWDASPYPSGIYFYKLHAGNFWETKKMLFLK